MKIPTPEDTISFASRLHAVLGRLEFKETPENWAVICDALRSALRYAEKRAGKKPVKKIDLDKIFSVPTEEA